MPAPIVAPAVTAVVGWLGDKILGAFKFGKTTTVESVKAAVGQKSDKYSRKWIVLAAFIGWDYLLPGRAPSDWLMNLVYVWMGTEGIADVARVIKRK